MSDTASEQSARVAPRGERRRADSPGVRIPPPVYYAAAFLIGYFLQSRFPLPFLPQPYGMALGGVTLALGVALALVSVVTMLRGKGTLNTNAASAQLVTTGVYRISRNPMYVSNVLIYTGFASLLGVTWALALLPLLIIFHAGRRHPARRALPHAPFRRRLSRVRLPRAPLALSLRRRARAAAARAAPPW